MDYAEFLARQRGIYDRFRSAQEGLRRDGALPDPVVSGRKGGLCVVLLPAPQVARALSDLSARLASVLPIVQYSEENIHFTLSDHGVADERVVDADDETLASMVRAVERMADEHRTVLTSCTFDLGEPLVNQTTAIVSGTPNAAFLETAELLREACATVGIDLRLPWGGHSTIGRFYRAVAAPDLEPLWQILASAPVLGQQRPTALEVRSFFSTSTAFLMNTRCRIELT